MSQDPKFQLWLRRALGQVMAWESELQIPDSEIKVEIKKNGRWVSVPSDQPLEP